MKRMHSNRRRPITFEALEGRLALSTGVGIAAASHHAHAVVMSQTQRTLPASFRGHVELINGTEMLTTNLRGTIGPDHFTGSGTGTVSGRQFMGGTVSLSNSKGSIELGLGSAYTVKVMSHTRQKVNLVVLSGTGKYAAYVGATGVLNTWNTPARPPGNASFSGVFYA